jgi:hypothetical protein
MNLNTTFAVIFSANITSVRKTKHNAPTSRKIFCCVRITNETTKRLIVFGDYC